MPPLSVPPGCRPEFLTPTGLETPLLITLGSHGGTELQVLTLVDEFAESNVWPIRLEPLARDEYGEVEARQIWYYVEDAGHECGMLRNRVQLPYPLCHRAPRKNPNTRQRQWCWNSQFVGCFQVRPPRFPTLWVLEHISSDIQLREFVIRPAVCADYVLSADQPASPKIHMWGRRDDLNNQKWTVTPKPLWWKIGAAPL